MGQKPVAVKSANYQQGVKADEIVPRPTERTSAGVRDRLDLLF
jgi:hypothetical protein